MCINPVSAYHSIPMYFNMNRYEEKSPVLLNHASTCGMVGGIFRLKPVPSPPRYCTKHYSHDSTPSPIAYRYEIVCSQTIFFVSIMAMLQPTILSNVCTKSCWLDCQQLDVPLIIGTERYHEEIISIVFNKITFPREGKENSPLHFWEIGKLF